MDGSPDSRGGDAAALAATLAAVAAAIVAVLWPDRVMVSDGQYAAFFAPIEWWSDAWVGGWPAAADPAAYAFHPVRLLLRPLGSFNLFVLTAYLAAAAGAFAYVRAIGASRAAAMLAGAAFAFSGFMVGHAMHTSMIQATAWSVLALAGVERCVVSGGRRGGLLAAGAVATACLAGHNQLALYGLGVLATYLVWRLPDALRADRVRGWTTAALAVATGVLLAAPALLLTLAYLPDTPRSTVGYETFVSRAIVPPELAGILFPFVFGGGGAPYVTPFFGRVTFAASCTHLPFVVLVLAAVGVGARTRGSVAVYWTLVVALATALSLGDAVPQLARAVFHVPLLDKFRAPSRHAMEIDLGLAVLAALGFDRCRGASRARQWLLPALVVAAVAIAAGWWIAGRQAQLAKQAAAVAATLPSPWRNPALVLPAALAAATAPALLAARRPGGGGVLLAVTAVQLAAFAGFAPWRRESPRAAALAPAPLERAVTARVADGGGRVLNVAGARGTLLTPERSRLLGLPSANWYGPLAPARALEALGMTTGGALVDYFAAPPFAALDMYGVRWVVLDGAPSATDVFALADESRWERIGSDGDAGVYENRRALPRAWLVGEWLALPEREAIARVASERTAPAFDPAVQALVADGPAGRVDDFDPGRVTAGLDVDVFRADVRSRSGGLLVCALNFVRGWTATVDGAPSAILRTDHALAGVRVPPGDHAVVLHFALPGAGWRWGALVSGLLGIGVLGRGRQAARRPRAACGALAEDVRVRSRVS